MGFSVERTQTYIKTAFDQKLAAEPQWLRLGHYKKTLSGSYKSKIEGPFFLNPNGAVDPQAELQSTIETLFSAPTAAKQCDLLARTKWLREKLNISVQDLVTCADRDAWKVKLNAKEAYFVFASSDLNSAASSFGHTFLRLHNPQNVGNLDLMDYGINFAAQTREDDGILFGLKGIFGMYSGSFSMMPYHQKLRDYINLEGRDIWEYKTSLTPAQVEMMIDHLIELNGSYVPYYFVDDNCSYAILELLEVVRPDLNLTSQIFDATIPIDTLKILEAQSGFFDKERRRPALRSDFQKLYDHLDSNQKNRMIAIIDKVKTPPKAEPIKEIDPLVLEATLSYLAIREYRNQGEFKDWKHQLSTARARLGPSDEIPIPGVTSPLESPNSTAVYLGVGILEHHAISRLKLRRAFHDLISRDDGLNPFSHVEVLSATLQYDFERSGLDVQELQLLKLISTNPVSRLDQPISWKTSLGTDPKFSPYLEGGIGFSFDVPIGQGGSRWINLLLGRFFESPSLEGRYRAGLGIESVFMQKLTRRWRLLEGGKFLAVYNDKPFFEMSVAVSFDITQRFESRLNFERKFDQDLLFFSLIF